MSITLLYRISPIHRTIPVRIFIYWVPNLSLSGLGFEKDSRWCNTIETIKIHKYDYIYTHTHIYNTL